MRNEQAVIYQPLPPWLVKTTTSVASPNRTVEHACEGRGFVIRCLDGRKMTVLDGVFEEFGKSLEFPDYYGRNSAALEECLNDLSWLSAPGYVLLITDSYSLLVSEPPSELTWLLTLLKKVCEEWSRPISIGEEWDRPAVPFHVVFLGESSEKTPFPPQIASLPELNMND